MTPSQLSEFASLRADGPPARAADFKPPLDPGIARAVLVLIAAGIETFESCEGGPGHAYLEPTVRFHGGLGVGFRALAAAQEAGLPVSAVRRGWSIIDLEPVGPYWEMTFSRNRNE